MRQLQLFTTTELAAMRDRSASRSYSPAGEAFRREHERHRAWGLTQRHAERLRQLHGSDCEPHAPAEAGMHPERRARTPSPSPRSTPLERAMRPTASSESSASQNTGLDNAGDRRGPRGKGSTQPSGPAGDASSRQEENASSRPSAPWRLVGDAPDAPIGKGANPPSGKCAAALGGKCDGIHNGNAPWRRAGKAVRLKQETHLCAPGAPPCRPSRKHTSATPPSAAPTPAAPRPRRPSSWCPHARGARPPPGGTD
jgi:hypothetical protein